MKFFHPRPTGRPAGAVRSTAYRNAFALAAALVGAAFFLALYGVQVLDPTNVDWILNSGADSRQHYLGWEFFRSSETRLPYLGMSYNTVYPYRISVVYTDSIPLLALIFKTVGAVLPAQFQYLGVWGLFCFMAQGALAQKIVWIIGDAEEKGKAARWATVVSAALFLLYPVLVERMFGHTALAGNWLILMGIWLWLRCPDSIGKACAWWGLLGVLCAGVHQYYLPMLGILAVGYAAARWLRYRRAGLALAPVLSFCACALAELVVLGAFAGNFSGASSSGWSEGADPLNLIVPGLFSSWEVDVYMGAGAVLACVLAIAAGCLLLLRRKNFKGMLRRWSPWIISALVISVLGLLAAASYSVTIGGVHLGELPLPAPILALWQMFSVCGRFAWLVGYLLLAAACGLILRCWRSSGIVLLTVCTMVQIAWQWDTIQDRYRKFHDDSLYTYDSMLQDDA